MIRFIAMLLRRCSLPPVFLAALLFWMEMHLSAALAPGSVDPSFSPVSVKDAFEGDRGEADILRFTCSGMALAPGKKIVAIGDFTQVDGVSRPQVVRLNPDGSVDSSFAPPADLNPGGAAFETLACQPDGKVILAFSIFDSKKLVRLNTNGSVDLQFHGDLPYEGSVTSLALQKDGKILAAGTLRIEVSDETKRSPLLRLNADGTVDPTFSCVLEQRFLAGSIITEVDAIRILSDGKILALGYYNYANGERTSRLIRLLPNGALDASFGLAITFGGPMNALAVDAAGGVFVGGGFLWNRYELMHGGPFGDYLARAQTWTNLLRFLPSAVEDQAFIPAQEFWAGSDGASVEQVMVQPDGKLLLAGYKAFTFPSSDRERTYWLGRLTAAGAIDSSFHPALGYRDVILGVLPLEDGKILVAGEIQTPTGGSFGVVRLSADGGLDATFHSPRTREPAPGAVLAVAQQTDGKLVIGGRFTHIQGAARANLARLNSDGSFDASFVPENYPAIASLALDPLGGVICAQHPKLLGISIANSQVFRLNPNGTLDRSFQAKVSSLNSFAPLHILKDRFARIFVEGQFTNFSGSSRLGLARLRTDGTSDDQFSPDPAVWYTNVGTNIYARAIGFQSDGSILAAVKGTQFRFGSSYDFNRLLRLRANGQRDASFVESDQFRRDDGSLSGIDQLFVLADDSFIATGLFTKFNSGQQTYPAAQVAHFNPDGTLRKGWTQSGDILGQSNDKLWGYFNDSMLRRSFLDGANDPSFTPISLGGDLLQYQNGFALQVWSIYGMHPQADGKMLAVGANLTLNGGTRLGEIVRLIGDPAPAKMQISKRNRASVMLNWLGGGSVVQIESSTDLKNWNAYGAPLTDTESQLVPFAPDVKKQYFRLNSK